MSSRNPPSQPLQGLDFVFESGLKKIDDYVKLIDALDLKVSVLIAFIGALDIGLLAAIFSSRVEEVKATLSFFSKVGFGVAFTATILGIYTAFHAFRMRQYYSGIAFEDLVRWTNEREQRIKEAFLPTIRDAIIGNEAIIGKKQTWAAFAVWCVFIALLAFVASCAEIAIRRFL